VIEAVGYKAGREPERTTLHTSGQPARLHLAADRPVLQAEYGDLAYVTVEIQDEQGRRVSYAEAPVMLEVSGAGDLLAVGTANPTSEELYVGNQRKAWRGRLMAVIRSTGQSGEIVLRASADGVAASELRLNAK
jgi:beta-galactosidase